ncbi:MAG: Fe-S cluster assembly ATPase SufC [Chloroflexi bacterium]|nr:Fe-S cluster assembly ATPase SufC [Chloroflexota bacterium]
MGETKSSPLLEVRDLRASVGGVEILKGVNLQVWPGELHAIMGPNGSGKSTLANVLAGNPAFVVTAGEALFQGENFLIMRPEERARRGFFLSFQHPIEIPGVRLDNFLRSGMNAVRKSRGLGSVDVLQFNRMLREKAQAVEIDATLLARAVNEGFSGGEKKRMEILQMAVFEPMLAVLDEPDSGLDVDALRIVAEGINRLRRSESATIVITHYQRILNYVVPDKVRVFVGGRIVQSGGKELALEVEAHGYDRFEEAAKAPPASV